MRYFIRVTSGITHAFLSLLPERQSLILWFFAYRKKLTLQNVIIHLKLIINRYKNHYYYNIFLEKCLCQLPKKQWQAHFWY